MKITYLQTYLLINTDRIMCLIRTRDFVAFLSNYGQLERAGTFHVALG